MRGSFVGRAALGAAICVVGQAAFAGTITGTVAYTGTVPNLKPLAVAAEPVCAKRHATVPNEALVLGAGNSHGQRRRAGRERPAGRQDLARADRRR